MRIKLYEFDLDETRTEEDDQEATCASSMALLMDIGVNPTDEYIQDCQVRLHMALKAAVDALREAHAYTTGEITALAGDINLSTGEWQDVIERLGDLHHANDTAQRLANKIFDAITNDDGDSTTIHFRAGDYDYINDVCEGFGFSL